MNTARLLRLPLLVGIPLLTLLLGWQLGGRYEQEKTRQTMERLNEITQSGSGSVATNPEAEVDLSLFWSVWRLLLAHYIEPGDLASQKLFFGAISGLVGAVGDPYTLFMTPPQNEDFRDSLQGNLEGIGAELIVKNGFIVVVSPIKGSPAERAGLLPDDVIITVDGKEVQGLPLTEVVSMIRGEKGTKVTITIGREGKTEPLSLTIVRDAIHIPSVESRVISATGAEVGYIALSQFGDTSIEEVREALRSFEKTPIKGIILDLRFNGGGYLDGAVELVSFFQKEGKVVSVEGRKGILASHSVSGDPILPEMPLVIIINKASASASEIAAGALQDHKRATIVGMTSFGKGTVQEIIDLPGGSSLRVTVAHWLTPNGKNLGKEGVHPDIEVDRTEEEVKAGRDPQLDAAVKALLQ